MSHPATGHVAEGPARLPDRKLGMWLFLASECMFFGALISTYLVYRGRSVQGPYPEELLNIPVTTVSTFVLLMSSLAMVLAVAAAKRHELRQTRTWLGVTVIMGAVFLGFQAYEYAHFIGSGLTLSVNLFGSTFYVLTGFHGVHVLIGVIWLAALFFHTFRPVDPDRRALDIDVAGLYWHFVDIVWIVVFTVVYLLGTV